ncbi:N1R/p28-like protein [Choristoneura biennis entomopoxvirus]|uniref:N1R/p28-like protein n=1 Tax=Choristoneura biennis entomopoxvirus TaxID=10288 RepID=A0A916KPQ5_CBEPV|nr:N1R/p28-like protein [Choristoneura biennis entomopoxvirus]CCU55790.1 N1R/p28-like protein [Choristoneura biennis entomopoxvirus]
MNNSLIKIDNNTELNYSSLDTLSNNFIYNFNKIFKYNNINIKTAGTANNPAFCLKDIIIDGFGYTKESYKSILKELNDEYKKSLYDIYVEGGNIPPTKNNTNKAIYVNEAGLYYLIFHCTKDSAKDFQQYVLFELIPSIRKISQEKYLNLINNQRDKIDELFYQNKQIISQNNELISKTSIQTNEILELNKQNQIAILKLKEIGINLLETNIEVKEVKNKLDIVIEDRNIKPKDIKYQHNYLLLKNKNINNEFKFIRAQEQYIKNKKSSWLEKYNICIDNKYNPNPMDLCIRLKCKILEMDKNRINNIKNKDKYKYDKKYLKDKLDNRKPFIEIRGNNFILNRCSEENFINIVKSIENEKYIV